MAGKFSGLIVLVCLSVAVYSAPQFNQAQFQSQPAHQFNQQRFQTQPAQQFNQARQFQVQPVQQPQPEQESRFRVIDEKFHQDPNLEYNFEQRFANGEEFKEDGKLRTVNGMDVIVTRGSYTIVEKDGSVVVVNYTADENGFHPEVVTQAPRK